MRRFTFLLLLFLFPLTLRAQEAPVRITLKPSGLVHGQLLVPVSVDPEVTRIELSINGVKFAEKEGRSVVFDVPIGNYIRRLRFRASGYDAAGKLLGQDEMVVNDPQPPFRAKLIAKEIEAKQTSAEMSASVIAPEQTPVRSVDFYYGEAKVGTDEQPPYAVMFNPSLFPASSYARIVAHAGVDAEANDVVFFGTNARESVDVELQRIYVSVVGKAPRLLGINDFSVNDSGQSVKLEAVTPASDEPLSLILLVDSSQSMMQELPVVKQAAKEFARVLLHGRDEMAVVGFHERVFWLTPFTNQIPQLDAAIDRIRPMGRTHLYDATTEMLFELQKRPGRHALVVLTDGANDGGDLDLDNLVHYVRYSGIPVYPVIKNSVLSKAMRFGVGYLQVRRVSQMAKDSGATYFIINKPAELAAVYRTIAEELNHQYTLMFYPAGGGGEQWHPLRIETTTGVSVRSPRGYFP